MKKVLILAYDFPPYVSVGGLRPFSWYKYFKEFGLYPIVVTRQWGNTYGNHLDYIAPGDSNESIIEDTEFGTIIRTPYKPNLSNRLLLKYGKKKFRLLRKLITAYFEFIQFLFFVGPKSGVYNGAKKYLKNNNIDCIIATGEPFVLFLYAEKLAKKNNIFWLADYRDPWALNTFNFKNPLIKPWLDYIEKKILKNVNIVTTVSGFLSKSLSKYTSFKTPIEVILNGFDYDLMESIQKVPQNNTILTFAYAGRIYPYHPFDAFFETLETCLKENKNFRFKIEFYGIDFEDVIKKKIATKYTLLKDYVSFTTSLPNKELLIKLAGANILFLFNEYSFMGTKIYDYIGVNRLILLCFTNEPRALELKNLYFPMKDSKDYSDRLQQDLLEKTNSGIAIKDTNELKNKIIELFNTFNKNKAIHIDSKETEAYSRKSQAKKLAEIINNYTKD